MKMIYEKTRGQVLQPRHDGEGTKIPRKRVVVFPDCSLARARFGMITHKSQEGDCEGARSLERSMSSSRDCFTLNATDHFETINRSFEDIELE
jgi:hypothetical protein